jgi:hypothetical protein
MKARLALTTILAFGALTFVACDDDDDPTGGGNEPETFTASLTGAAEVPPVTTDATGSAGFTVTRSTGTPTVTTVAYSATVTGLSGPATAAHIHGPADVNTAAGIIVPLTVTGTGTSGQIISGSFTTTGNPNVSVDSLVVLLRNGNSYINIHTAANVDGEIRGQIRP